jgi:transcriptional regulator with XRE-family HTH domain
MEKGRFDVKALINKSWFGSQLAARKISQRKLAELMGMDASAMSLLLNGKRKMSATEAGEVAKHLGATVEDVLRNAGVSIQANPEKTLPISGVVVDRLEVKMGRPQGPQSIVAPAGTPRTSKVLRVQADGPMGGWLLLYQPVSGVSMDAVNRLCVVRKVGDDRLYVRWVNRGYETGWFSLSGLGLAESEHAQLESASPVLWIKQ